MEISRSEFMAFLPEKVHEFVLQRSLLRQEHADMLLKHEVKGSRLLRSSAKVVMDMFGLPGGIAVDLVEDLGKMFPDEGLIENLFLPFPMCAILAFLNQPFHFQRLS